VVVVVIKPSVPAVIIVSVSVIANRVNVLPNQTSNDDDDNIDDNDDVPFLHFTYRN
jgi:hypothetical protein